MNNRTSIPMFKTNKKNRKGIIALFPALIISSILLILCVGVSQSLLALMYRTTIFDKKTQSQISVESCVSRVLAKRVQNVRYMGGESIMVGEDFCDIATFTNGSIKVSVQVDEAKSAQNIDSLAL